MSDVNLPGLVIPIEARITQLERSLKKAADAQNREARNMERRAQLSADRMANSYNQAGARISATFTNLGATVARGLNPLGFAVGAIGSAVSLQAIRSTIAELSNLAKAADRVGLSTREFQGLEFGLGQAGVKAEDLNRAMETLAQRVGEAQRGAGPLVETLQAFNVSLTDDTGQLRSQFELLREMAEVLRGLPNQAQRLAVAQAAFGTAGRDMVNALANGAGGIDAMIEAAEEAGLVMDDALLRRAEEIDDRFDLLARQMRTGFRSTVVNMVDGFIQMGDSAGDFLDKIQEIIRELPNIKLPGGGEIDTSGFNIRGALGTLSDLPGAYTDFSAQMGASAFRAVDDWFEREGREKILADLRNSGLTSSIVGPAAHGINRIISQSTTDNVTSRQLSDFARNSITPGVLGEEVENLFDLIQELSPETRRLFEEFKSGFAESASAAGVLMIELADVENSLNIMGDIGAADVMQQFRLEIGSLRDDLLAGNITMEEFQEKLSGISQRAENVARDLNATNLVSFDRVISKIDGLRTALASAASAALNLRPAVQQAVEQIAQKAADEERRVWHAAEAASREADAANQRWIQSQRDRNAMTSEQLRLETEVMRVRQQAADAGVNLPQADIERVARERIEAEDRRRNENRPERPERTGGGGGGTAQRASELESLIQTHNEQIRLLEVEALALTMAAAAGNDYARAIEIARREAELLVAAERDGVEVTDELRARISEMASAYADAEGHISSIREELEAAQRAQREFTDALRGGFVDLLTGASSFDEALAGIARRLADIAANKAFDMIFMPLLAKIPVLGFSEGGYTGDGGKLEPKGVVHGGEFVISKAATQKIGVDNLERLHQSALKGYSSGGLVGGNVRQLTAASGASSVSTSIEINAPVTVNANGGTPEQNADLARQMAEQTEKMMRGVVQQELVRQMRPGGILR